MEDFEKQKRYVSKAKQELAALEVRILDFQKIQQDARRGTLEPELHESIDLASLYNDLKRRVRDVGEYLDELTVRAGNVDLEEVGNQLEELKDASEKRLAVFRDEGETRWSLLQARAEIGFWEFRSLLQQIGEGISPLMDLREEPRIKRYYFQKALPSRWALVQEGVSAPTKLFARKRDGLKEARLYVRDRKPSELIIRRLDGTFQSVHRYRT